MKEFVYFSDDMKVRGTIMAEYIEGYLDGTVTLRDSNHCIATFSRGMTVIEKDSIKE